MVLPQPTSPYRYNPLGRLLGMLPVADFLPPDPNKDENMDFLVGLRDSMVGCSTGGASYRSNS